MVPAVQDVCRTIVTFLIGLSCFLSTGNCSSWNLFGRPGDGYYISVNIGEPPQTFNLLLDTGSSNFAIAGTSYPGLESFYDPKKSSTFEGNGSSTTVFYTQGWWKGYTGKDFVHIPSLDYIQPVRTDLAIITRTHGFYVNNSHWQGILGLAYSEIAKPQGYVASWFDSLSEALPEITNHRFDMELCGPQYPNSKVHHGRFSVGDFKSACSKTEYSTPILRRWYYEVLITSFQVGQEDIEEPCENFNTPKTIIDSGTSYLQLSMRSHASVIAELKRQTETHFSFLEDDFWNGKKEICQSQLKDDWEVFPQLTIFLAHDEGTHFGIKIPSRAYLRPVINRTDEQCWILGIEKGEIGTVLGTVALEGFCVVFDQLLGVISFMESDCGPQVYLTSLLNRTDPASCKYEVHVVNGPLIASSVILAMVLLPLGVAFVRWLWIDVLRPRVRRSSVPFISLDDTNT